VFVVAVAAEAVVDAAQLSTDTYPNGLVPCCY